MACAGLRPWCRRSVCRLCHSFCDITGSLDIVTLEQTAINAFIAMEQSLTNPPTDDCKKAMHTWMCWQVRQSDSCRALHFTC